MSDFIMICAVLLAPAIAVQVQKWLEGYRERRWRRVSLFKALMATRATTLAPRHVEALNGIDLEFDGANELDKRVRTRWKEYLDQLGNVPKDGEDEKQNDANWRTWTEKTREMLADLLHDMGKAVGYDFDKVHIKKAIYAPQGHYNVENEQHLIRRLTLDLLIGRRALPMDVRSLPAQNGNAEVSPSGTHNEL
jgi:hypothetical protein